MERSIFATNLDQMLEDKPGRFRWWASELQIPRTTLHRWVAAGLAKPDKRSEPYLLRVVDYFGLPNYDCLWHENATSKADKNRIRLAATRRESRIVRKKESPQQATRVIEDAGLWNAFKRKIGATSRTEAELALAEMVINGNWDSASIIDHMQYRGIADVDVESQVERARIQLGANELWDVFMRMHGLGSDEDGEQKLWEMLSGFWMPTTIVWNCARRLIKDAEKWSAFKLWIGTSKDDHAETKLGEFLAEGETLNSILEKLRTLPDGDEAEFMG